MLNDLKNILTYGYFRRRRPVKSAPVSETEPDSVTLLVVFLVLLLVVALAASA